MRPLRPLNQLKSNGLNSGYVEVPPIPVATCSGAQIQNDAMARLVSASAFALFPFDDKGIFCWGSDFADFESVKKATARPTVVRGAFLFLDGFGWPSDRSCAQSRGRGL